jgi:diguanylate cyclase (GGDEF)-like protein
VVDLSENGSGRAGAVGERAADVGDGASDAGERALDVVLGCFAYEVGADTGQILGRENGDTRVVAIWALDGDERVEPWVSDSFLGRALADGAASVDLDANGAGPDQPRRVRAVAAPILADGSTLGVAYAGFIGSPRLGADELCWTADSYARMAAMCMTSETGLAAVLRASALDQLTGCLNWAAAIEMARAEVERAQRGGHRLSCCFFDLDEFKRVNDERGHIEGNRVLAAVGPALRASFRGYDSVGRFGGDEFVAILPETDAHTARPAAARAAVAASSAIHAATGESIEISVGVAEWDSYEAGEDLVERADRAMRAAKAAGGARVVADGPQGHRLDGLSELSSHLANALDASRDRSGRR